MQQQQVFLDTFPMTHLKSLTSERRVLGRCRLVANLSTKDYNQLVAKGGSQAPLRRLPPDQYLWGLVDRDSGELISCLHLAYFHTCMGGAEPGPQHILQWCYAYTLDDPRYRRQGCSLALRLASMCWAQTQGYGYLNSVPLPGAHSNPLLLSLGFTAYYAKQDDDVYYIYRLGSPDKLESLVRGRLTKYL